MKTIKARRRRDEPVTDEVLQRAIQKGCLRVRQTWKGYTGTIEDDGETWFGKLRGIKDLVTYEADSALDLNMAFRAAVDNYLSTCRMLGHEPQRPAESRNGREGRYVGRCASVHVRWSEHAGPPIAFEAYSHWMDRENRMPPEARRRRPYISKAALARLQAHVHATLDRLDRERKGDQ